MEKRTILAIVLSIAVVLVYQIFFMKPPPPKPEATQKESPAQAKPAGTQPTPAQASSTQPKILTPPPAAAPGKDIKVETGLYTAVFTTRDASLKSFRLKGYNKTIEKNAAPVELVDVQGNAPKPLTITFPESNIDVPPGVIYETTAASIDMTKSAENRQISFSFTHKGELRIEKTYTFYPDKYSVGLEVKVTNLSANPISQNASLTWYHYVDPKAEADSYGHDGPVYYIAKDMEQEDVKKLEKSKSIGPDVSWAGFESKYFIAAMIPQSPPLTSLSMSKDLTSTVAVTLKGPKNLIPQGQFGAFNYTLYMGPKDYNILKGQGVGLENSVDFGSWLKWLAIPLLVILKFTNQYVANYGLSIIILTLLIKVIFWPLGNMSYKSMKEMQKLQPKIKEIQEKHKSDKQKLSQETMALYKTHKVNPFGGCLPMLIQIPVFFGLYKALLYAIELRHAPLVWWIQDLSAKDPYYITPVIMGATMFIQQKMTPMPGDPMQAKIMLWLPVIFTFMFLSFPSGLVIYWLFNNILSIGQQYYINKKTT